MHRVSVIGVRWPTRPSGAAIGDVNPIHGMSGRPNPYSIRDMMTKHEIAYRVRVPRGAAPWRRRPRSSRRAGKPSTGRRGSGSPMPGPGGTRHAESRPGLEASLSGYWRAVYLETCTHGSERVVTRKLRMYLL